MTLDRDPSDVFYDKWKDAEARADEWKHRASAVGAVELLTRAEAAEAERNKLREALREIAEHRTGQRTLTMHAFAALGEEVPSWSS